MPQIKKSQPLYGIQFGKFPTLKKYLRPIKIQSLFTSEELLKLIEIAANSYFIKHPNFADIYTRQPDEVLEVLIRARRDLANQKKTGAGIVRECLLTHASFDIKGKLKDVSFLTDGDIAQHLTKPGQSITAETVKTERKALNKRLRPIADLQTPKRKLFMQKGANVKIKKNPKMDRGQKFKMSEA